MNGRVPVSKKLVIINSASSLITRVLSLTVLIWVQQFLLKRITVEEYSLLPVIFSLMIFLPFFGWILTSGIKRYVLVAYAEDNEEQITRIVSSIFPVLCLLSLFLVGIGGLLAWKIDVVLRIAPEHVNDARIMVMLVILLEVFRYPMEAFCSGLYVRQRFVLANLIKIACECFRLALLFILLLGVSVSVISVITASVAAGFAEISVLFIVSRLLLPSQEFKRSEFNWSIVKKLIQFGRWSALSGLSGMIRKSADAVILNRFSTPLDVTCFHLGALIPNRMEIIVNQSFLDSVSPVIVGLHVDKQGEKLKNVYLRLGRFAMWGVLLVIAPFLIHYEQIVTLYVGEAYLSAGTVMFLLLACYPIIYGNILYGPLATAKAFVRQQSIREVASVVVNLILTLFLVGYYQMGAIGAATATFIVYGLGSILFFWPFGRGMVGATWHEVLSSTILPGITPFMAGLLAMKFLVIAHPAESWTAIALNAMLGSCIYFAALWFVAKEIDKQQFRDALLHIVGRKSGG